MCTIETCRTAAHSSKILRFEGDDVKVQILGGVDNEKALAVAAFRRCTWPQWESNPLSRRIAEQKALRSRFLPFSCKCHDILASLLVDGNGLGLSAGLVCISKAFTFHRKIDGALKLLRIQPSYGTWATDNPSVETRSAWHTLP